MSLSFDGIGIGHGVLQLVEYLAFFLLDFPTLYQLSGTTFAKLHRNRLIVIRKIIL